MMRNLEGQMYVSGREIRVDFPNGISVQRITQPRSKLMEQFWKSYRGAFPTQDQREPKWRLQEIASGSASGYNGLHDEAYIMATMVKGNIVGGNIFDYMEGTMDGRCITFGVYWYLFSDESHRGLIKVGNEVTVIATKTHGANLQTLQYKAAQRGVKMDALVMEMEKPKTGFTGQVIDRVIRHQRGRLAAASHLGFKVVDPEHFSYMQPALTDAQRPYEGLLLLVKPLREEWSNEIPVGDFEQFLYTYVWGGFAGMKGSNLDGHRNPETDESFREMSKQLDSLKERGVTYLNLVSPLKYAR